MDNYYSNQNPYYGSAQTITTDEPSNSKTDFKTIMLIFCFSMFAILFLVAVLYFTVFKKKSNETEQENIKEPMTSGTLTQLFATDAQNKALNGDTDDTATGNFNLYWGQPTRVASTYPNRGQLLPATIISQVAAQQNGNDPNKLDINLNKDMSYSDQLNQKVNKLVNYLDNTENKNNNNFLQQNCGENCYTNPQACGNGAGGYRLGSDFVEPTTAKPFVSLQGNLYMPDQYTGSYWIAPKPDIMKPLPVVANGLYPLNNQNNTT